MIQQHFQLFEITVYETEALRMWMHYAAFS